MTAPLLLLGKTLDAPDQAQRIEASGQPVFLVTRRARFDARYDLGVNQVLITELETDALAEVLDSIHEASPFSGVLSLTQPFLDLACQLGRRWSLPHLNPKAVALLPDKTAMRLRLSEHDELSVPHRLCRNVEDILNFHASLGRPVIVKPAKGNGSIGVTFVDSENRAKQAMARIEAVGDMALAELWLGGREFSVETFSLNKRHHLFAITEKIVDKNFIETGHLVPARLSTEEQARIWQQVQTFLDHVSLTDGPGHTEIKVDGSNVAVIESHNRFGGGQITKLMQLALGIDTTQVAAKWACGEGFAPTPNTRTAAAAVRFITLPQGRIRQISAPTEGQLGPESEMVEHTFKLGVGDFVPELAGNMQRAGYFIVKARTADAAFAEADRLESLFRIDVEPRDGMVNA
ncbi:hypothetical protein GCM10007385_01070 [Tateyamaria omphalii]|uniref:ATP-grasp domain-containing protein n=1 Tax=Tateyamaria omphalii TaxID=299262 RepID=UPI0016731B63|nr:ATP-grasp domain-containing protein [Tateyamaria omphalii]GGX38084.1 hypothetical protein GCM10007385_01070 [Tateyamaria omphalii]